MSKEKINIHIGEYHASRKPTVIGTLLGSCVAVCLFDPASRIGGMNHILLPGKADLKHFDAPARYGINAMELLINKIMILGGDRRRLIAKVFGGAHLLPTIDGNNGVGQRIADFVLEFLKIEGFRIVARDLGGHDTRKIFFHTDTGELFLKRFRSMHYPPLCGEEQRMMQIVGKKIDIGGKVALF